MKKLLCIGALTCALASVSAQNAPRQITPDPMLYELFPAEKLELYQEEAPEKLAHLNYRMQHFCYVSQEIPEDSQPMGDIADVKSPEYALDISSIIAKQQINPYFFSFLQGETKYFVYTIGSTGWYVVVYPQVIYYAKEKEYLDQVR